MGVGISAHLKPFTECQNSNTQQSPLIVPNFWDLLIKRSQWMLFWKKKCDFNMRLPQYIMCVLKYGHIWKVYGIEMISWKHNWSRMTIGCIYGVDFSKGSYRWAESRPNLMWVGDRQKAIRIENLDKQRREDHLKNRSRGGMYAYTKHEGIEQRLSHNRRHR